MVLQSTKQSGRKNLTPEYFPCPQHGGPRKSITPELPWLALTTMHNHKPHPLTHPLHPEHFESTFSKGYSEGSSSNGGIAGTYSSGEEPARLLALKMGRGPTGVLTGPAPQGALEG